MTELLELIGESPPMRAVKEQVRRLVGRQTDARRLPPLLIEGETGTGKGLLARAIHRAGPRRAAPFVDVNCAAIPDTLLEAEMFGFERGAFTDARDAKAGLFQAANHGMLFLDEVALLPEPLQAKLLTVLEERTVRRLGSTRNEPVDVWIIAGTNEDLAGAVGARRFREDLYHRLAVLTITLPPLRERGDDVVRLAEQFLARACADYGLPPKTLAANARETLLAYPWPGNVRELGNVIERVALLSDATVVSGAMLALPQYAVRGSDDVDEARPSRFLEAVAHVEREHLLDALRETDWNISRAAARLGITRNTLRYRIDKHALQPGKATPRRRRAISPPPEPRAERPPVTPAAAPEPAAPLTAIRWERRRVTALRADIVSERADAAGLGRPLAIVLEKLRGFGGRVEELGPSGLIGVFGLEPVEDAARRAANAALAMRKAAERSRTGDGAPSWAVKIALHTGDATVARTAAGAAIDLETKQRAWLALGEILAAAQPDDVLVDASVVPHLERRFELTRVAHAARPIHLLGRRETAGFAAGGTFARFVGRERELDLLRSRFEVAASGQGQVVGIVGEAGIGKSRLLFEFRQWCEKRDVTYLEGHGLSYGSAIPYAPILDVVRASFGLAELDTADVIADKVRRGLRALGIDAEDTSSTILELLGLDDGAGRFSAVPPDAGKTRTFETLRQLALRQARRAPAVIAIEDLQWIDRMSEEYVGTLIDTLGGARLLVVVTHRPGYRAAWTKKSYAMQISLGPLDARDSATIVESILGSGRGESRMRDAFLDEVLAKAEGNPFFIEEIARAVRGSGGPRRVGDVPGTVQEVIAARIGQLPDPARRVLQAASVLGRRFSRRLLGAIWDEPGELDREVATLTRDEFVYEESAGDEPTFVFNHPLTQEVARGSLLDEPRRSYHRAALRAIEDAYAGRLEDAVDLLAYHAAESDDDDKAVDYAMRAAERAQRRWANVEALAGFEAAQTRLERMPDSEENRRRRIDAVLKQAEGNFALGRHAEQIAALDRIQDLALSSGDAARRAGWYSWAGFLHSLVGSPPATAIRYCGEAVAIAAEAGLEDIGAIADCGLAQVYVVVGRLSEAILAGERALRVFEANGNVWWSCRALWHLSTAANALGQWSRSLEYCRRALELGRAVDDRRLKVVGLWRTGSTQIQRGDAGTGLHACDEAMALSPTAFDAAMVTGVHGYGRLRLGDVDGAIPELADAVRWFEGTHLRYTWSIFAAWLAEGHLRRGDTGQATALVTTVLELSRRLGYRHLEGTSTRVSAECLAQEDVSAALDRVDVAIVILEEVGATNEVARAFAVRAELRARKGDVDGARAMFGRALALFEGLGTVDEPPRIRAALDRLGD